MWVKSWHSSDNCQSNLDEIMRRMFNDHDSMANRHLASARTDEASCQSPRLEQKTFDRFVSSKSRHVNIIDGGSTINSNETMAQIIGRIILDPLIWNDN